MLEVIMIALLSSCISSTKIKANLDYLRSLESEEIFSDSNGIYTKTIYPNQKCKIEFEPNFNFGEFHQRLDYNKVERTITWLEGRYCIE